MADRGIYERNGITGEIIYQIKMGSIETLIRLGLNRIFSGPLRNRYLIYAVPNIRVPNEFSPRMIDPNRCLSLIILSANLRKDTLHITGWEQYPNMQYTTVPTEPLRFSRSISIVGTEHRG